MRVNPLVVILTDIPDCLKMYGLLYCMDYCTDMKICFCFYLFKFIICRRFLIVFRLNVEYIEKLKVPIS